jgi:hypothetical protein
VRSLGEGIEREVIHTLFEEFRNNRSQWFMPRADGHCTLATTHTMSTARHIPPARLRSLSILGAITAFTLLHGMSATPWDPAFLHFMIHGCDIASIHRDFLYEWHPSLKQTITEWLEVGPLGDITRFQHHFSTYHDLQVVHLFLDMLPSFTDFHHCFIYQVACLRDRDEASHASLAAEMLYRSVIGPEPPSHPELLAFRKGFELRCHNGLTFFDVS